MQISDFDFVLPQESIAQRPPQQRAESRLLTVDRTSGAIEHLVFSDLRSVLPDGAVLVLNDTKVIPARLRGNKEGTGGRVELLLVEPRPNGDWFCMGRSSKRFRLGMRLLFGATSAVITAIHADGYLDATFETDDFEAFLETNGALPLPPYIDRPTDAADAKRYQTVYARCAGAVAAPTAGLHFDKKTLRELAAGGIQIEYVTLHVGPGTFMPVRTTLEAHQMHEERYMITDETAARLNRAKRDGLPIVAVGTTVVRTLEAAASLSGELAAGAGRTRLFISPGYTFRVVDCILTNFHLPRSTLIMLVAALVGRENLLNAYRVAVSENYRFYSYGDAMFIR